MATNRGRHLMALPAYDQCIKASHVFNLLDARGVISVTERQSYILRVRELAKACGEAWLATEGGGKSYERNEHERNVSEMPEIGGRRRSRSRSRPARAIGGAPAGARRRSRSATARTRARDFSPRIEFKPATAEEVWFCACKRSAQKPMCDGSHKTLR